MTEQDTSRSSKGKWVSHRKRATRLAGMTASIVGKYTSNRLRSRFQPSYDKDQAKADFYRDIGKQVVSTLGELKGAAMKLGQMLSQMQHLFPKEFTDELVALQNQAPAMDYSAIERQIILELGNYPEKLFQSFDKTPMASASIGQVHRATTFEGEEVVMKIQYPGVEKACKTDLKHLRRLLKLGGLFKVDPDALEAVFNELSVTLIRELDYLEEAQQLKQFHQFFADDEQIIIPKVLDQYSSQAILTTSLEQGDSIKTAATDYPQAIINQLGDNLFHFIGKQVFEFDRFHSDPHPGNFAFRNDGTLVVYDFGSITPMTNEQKFGFHQFMEASVQRDFKALEQALLSLQVRNQSDTVIPDDFYALWSDILMAPFESDQPYDFKRSKIHKQTMKEWKTVLPYWNDFQPSPDTVFINRVIGGFYLLLVEMGAQCEFKAPLNGFITSYKGKQTN